MEFIHVHNFIQKTKIKQKYIKFGADSNIHMAKSKMLVMQYF